MGSKTIAVSSKQPGVATDAQKRLVSMKGLSDSTKSKVDVEDSSDEEDIGEMNITDKTDSDEVDDEMDEEDDEEMEEEEDDEDVNEEGDEEIDGDGEEEIDEEDYSGSSDEEEGIGGDSKNKVLKGNMSDSSDEDGGRTMEDGDGVEFSDGDDDDLEGDEDQQNAEETEGNDIKVAANPAWAQAMAKILRTQKPSGKKAVALSKARTIQAAESAAVNKEEEPDFEIVGEKEGKLKIKTEDAKPTAEELHEAKRQRLAFCRIKQEDFDYNRERALTKIATKGVVQLFNAVRSQQKNLGSKLAEAHSTRMEEKLLKSIDKDAFLEHLTGKIRSRPVESVQKEVKKEEGEIVLPKSWDELSKKVESSSWDKVIEIKDEPGD